MPEVQYSQAPEAEEIGTRLIEEGEEFAHLKDALIVYVFCDQAPKRSGRPVYGTAEVVKGKKAHLFWRGKDEEQSDPFYVVTVSEDLWEKLDEEQQRFVVRHQLRRCGVKNNKRGRRLIVTPYDVELFLTDLTDTCWETVCSVWSTVQEAKAGQPALPLDG
jgi:hypothetical protein